jgi:hypothetical protein
MKKKRECVITLPFLLNLNVAVQARLNKRCHSDHFLVGAILALGVFVGSGSSV